MATRIMATQRTGNPIIRNSLLFGALLGLLGLGNALPQWRTGAEGVLVHTTNGVTSVTVTDTGPSALLGCVVFLALLVLTFVAGMLTARKNGSVGSGAVTGLLVGIVGTLVGSVAHLLILVVGVAPNLQAPAGGPMTQSQVRTVLIGITVVGAIFGLLLTGGLGAGMGALGGLVGANGYRKVMLSTPASPAYSPFGSPGMPAQWPSAPPSQQPPHADIHADIPPFPRQ